MFQLLLKYKKEHGDTLVPHKWRGYDKQLGVWVNNQQRPKELLAQLCILRLNSIGFVWNPIENRLDRWEEMFQLLLEYKKNMVTCPFHTSTEERIISLQVGCLTNENFMAKNCLLNLAFYA